MTCRWSVVSVVHLNKGPREEHKQYVASNSLGFEELLFKYNEGILMSVSCLCYVMGVFF